MFEHGPRFTCTVRSLNPCCHLLYCYFHSLMQSTLKWLKCWSLVISVDNGISQNEDFACYKPPSVTLVSFGCCVLLAVSLTGWCRWLVGGAFTCVHCWYFSLFVRNWFSPCFSPSSNQTGKIAVRKKYKNLLRIQFLWSWTSSWTNKFLSIWLNL